MSDVWFGPGLTRNDYESFLRALSLDSRNAAPLLAVATGEAQTATLVMASHAFFALFGVRDSEALSRRLLAGSDPGARRLADLFASLPLDGAPRLERLRFTIGPASEIITFLCRRFTAASGLRVFVAAALGVRPGLMPAAPPPPPPAEAEPSARAVPVAAPQPSLFDAPIGIDALRATLAERWPSGRARFVWRTDADGICREVSPSLAAIVGSDNGDLVGKNLVELAPRLDPTGRLAAALAGRATWSGVDVDWPIADAPGAVGIGLGAVPAFGADRGFDGFRGYGVIHLDRLVAREPMRLVPLPQGPRGLGNVVPFPGGGKGFSAEDQLAFVALGAALRDHVGLAAQESETGTDAAAAPPPEPVAPPPEVPSPATAVEPPPPATLPEPEPTTPVPAASVPAGPLARGHDLAGANGLAILDRVTLGLLVSRDNVPIFANRHLLDLLGFADEDALHEAGGLARLFGGDATADLESLAVRRRDGSRVSTLTRLQRIEWDGLPATLLTLQPATDPSAAASLEAEHDAAIEAMARGHADERRRDDCELRHMRAILETATDGVAVLDAATNVMSLNRSGEALLGRDRSTVIGRPFLDLFAPDNQGLARDYLDGLTTNARRSLLNDGRELNVKAPQGGTIPVFMTLGRLDQTEPEPALDAGSDALYCALFRDLTHWKKVEHELETAKHDAEAASAAKTDFLAKISHEVRTPLNAIIGFAEVIMEERFGPVGNARYKDYMRDIHTSGMHVMSLVNDLLDLSKIEAGRMELAPTAVDANRIVSDCVGLMQPQASRARIIMRLSLAPALPMVRADERSLRQIVLNLLSNAVKYNEPGGQVIVATTAPEDGRVVVRVRDTGAGMSEADIVAALEPFRQVSTRPKTEGTGLGLPLTKALVEANEAVFSIRSKVDQGTLVEVAFPPALVLAGQR